MWVKREICASSGNIASSALCIPYRDDQPVGVKSAGARFQPQPTNCFKHPAQGLMPSMVMTERLQPTKPEGVGAKPGSARVLNLCVLAIFVRERFAQIGRGGDQKLQVEI